MPDVVVLWREIAVYIAEKAQYYVGLTEIFLQILRTLLLISPSTVSYYDRDFSSSHSNSDSFQ